MENTFRSTRKLNITHKSISAYIDHFIDAFIIKKAEHYDIKGRKYIGAQQKYFFTDLGLRNARLKFRQQEENHIMENILYNELTALGFSVDVGVVETMVTNSAGNRQRSQLEVDFVSSVIMVATIFSQPLPWRMKANVCRRLPRLPNSTIHASK